MDFEQYARTAAALVNARIMTLQQLREFFGAHNWPAAEATERDVVNVRRAAKRLREVFEHGAAGHNAKAATALNVLLEAYPLRLQVSVRDPDELHMKVTCRGSSISADYLAGAAWGLAVWLCRHRGTRFGVCADERCGNVYLDTSSNCCRRFCSERCATRSHVAAHRARKRDRITATSA